MSPQAAQQLDGADPASPAFGFGAILALGWPGGSSRGRWVAAQHTFNHHNATDASNLMISI